MASSDEVKIDFSSTYDLFEGSPSSVKMPEYKTKIVIGGDYGIVVGVEKRFNWFQKKMMNWCFGWKVTDID